MKYTFILPVLLETINYVISFSNFQDFPGNKDANTIVRHSLSTAVKARFVRFYPVTYQSWPCLRVEIFVLK